MTETQSLRVYQVTPLQITPLHEGDMISSDTYEENDNLQGGNDAWHHTPAPLHQVIQVPSGKKHPSLQFVNVKLEI